MTKNILMLTKDLTLFENLEESIRKDGYLHLADNLSILHETLMILRATRKHENGI